jgi:phage/plasmid-like protein (TIGR03299 family)
MTNLQDWGWNAEDSSRYSAKVNQEEMDLYRGVGATVVQGQSLADRMAEAGLDWQVEQSGFRYGDRYQHRAVESHKAIYRGDTGTLLGVAGKDWTPHQNTDILGTFEQFCTSSGLEIEHIGALREGRSVFAVARTDDQFDLGGDEVQGKIIFTGSHEPGRGHRVDLMTLRKICGNGLTVPVRAQGKVINHIGGWDTYKVLNVLESAKTNFRQVQQQSERLAETPISIEEATLHLIQAFGDASKPVEEQPKIVQTCLALFQGRAKGSHLIRAYNTAWGLLNSVTEYYNHHSRATSAQSHLNSLWMGNKAQQQQKFLTQMVSVYAQ